MLVLIMLVVAILSCFITIWWLFMPLIFLVSFFWLTSPRKAFWSGFISITLVWTLVSLPRSILNHHVLAHRMALLFSLPHWILLLVLTALIGGLLGGLSALSGNYCRNLFIILPGKQ